MIREVKMFAAFCDNCGKQCNDDYAGICAWSDEVGARESACECRWLNHEGKDYCPDCYSFDDDDNLVLREIEKSHVSDVKNVTNPGVNDSQKTEGDIR